jgi:hypothetical protein
VVNNSVYKPSQFKTPYGLLNYYFMQIRMEDDTLMTVDQILTRWNEN